MWILNPNNSSHDVFFVPRHYDLGTSLRVELENEDNRQVTTLVPEQSSLVSEYLRLRIKVPCSEGQSFRVKVYDIGNNNQIYYRCKAFCTEQVTQEYKING